MKKFVFSSVVAAAVGLTAAGCTNLPGSPTVSFTSPLSAGPANGTSYKFKQQPVTVSITNAVRTSATAVATYNVEVASDSAFSNKVFTRDGIAEGGGGTTSVTVSQLPAGSGNVTYYWRWSSVVEGVTSRPSDIQSFVVQQQIIVNAPTLSAPTGGTVTSELRPTFTAKNASRQGAVGTITYVFQIAKSTDFSDSNIVAKATLNEQSGGTTTWTPNTDLPAGTLYWHVQARDDANTEVSPFTSALSFVIEPFDPRKAFFLHSPPGVADWDETAKITSVDFSNGFMEVDFDRRVGPAAWPEAGGTNFGPLQYSLGMCFNINGQWYCSAPVQFWEGRELSASGRADQVADNWYYDPARWGPMSGHQPDWGERVAVWVGQGNLRGANGSSYRERSNFVIIKFGDNYRAPGH